MLPMTNTTMMLKSTSVCPGAVMKNGRCAVAAGLGEAVKGHSPTDGASIETRSHHPRAAAHGLDLDQAYRAAIRRGAGSRVQAILLI
jgi:hypothetical protein